MNTFGACRLAIERYKALTSNAQGCGRGPFANGRLPATAMMPQPTVETTIYRANSISTMYDRVGLITASKRARAGVTHGGNLGCAGVYAAVIANIYRKRIAKYVKVYVHTKKVKGVLVKKLSCRAFRYGQRNTRKWGSRDLEKQGAAGEYGVVLSGVNVGVRLGLVGFVICLWTLSLCLSLLAFVLSDGCFYSS